jgi:starch synthase
VARSKEKASKTLRVLYIAAEAEPIIKVGGLGDVTGSLPRALQALRPAEIQGVRLDIRLVIPFHPAIPAGLKECELVATFPVPHPQGPIEARAFLTHVEDLPVYLIAGNPIPKDGPVYSQDTRKDGEKFTFFSLAALELARALNWPPDILHANDWHTAIAVYLLALRRKEDPFFSGTRSVFTIHNLPFMGAGTEDALASFGIPPLQDPRLPLWGSYQPLPIGLATADALTTVSPSYAREILTPEYGCGLQDFLQLRAGDLTGILNGLDEAAWNPAADPILAAPFSPKQPGKRMANKQALIRETARPPNLDLPLIILVSRMDYQKGIDIAVGGLRQIAGIPWQAILLGTGDAAIEASARQLEAEFPYRVRAILRFDCPLARRMYGSGDMILMPSRYEPCGLSQMISMRYGCIPIARATGGLKDTVIDARKPEQSTGFLYEGNNPEALAAAMRRAITAYNEPGGWQARQNFAMQQDFSWHRSAQAYAGIYQKLCDGATR